MSENENKSIDPKLAEALKGIWDSLTDEQKEKAKACKTMDELTALAGKEGVELPDELLDAVAGGFIYKNREKGLWQVIDDYDGKVVDQYFKGAKAARYAAILNGQSWDEIHQSELEELRAHPGSISKDSKIFC
ncbi:MAG: hypothetical protein E7422_06390 [Ruminococcaceae bacterium]|jgi:hypothetical protein|nr:hypothetical protein [Oscillospiraceae bacterium]